MDGGDGRSPRKVMTPQLAESLTIHEPEIAAVTVGGEALAGSPVVVPLPSPLREDRPDLDDACLPALWRREALHRRLLGLFDVTGASLVLLLVLGLTRTDHAAIASIGGPALLVVLFKVAGLYDRDEVRLVHSTLDELPLLFQLTGLFALCVTIVQSAAVEAALSGWQIATLWAGSCAAVLLGRTVARSVAGRIAPTERCLVIGEPELAQRIRERLGSSAARATVVASLPLTRPNLGALDTPASLRRVVSELQVHRIILAPSTIDTSEVAELIRVAKAVGVRVSVLPRMFEVIGAAVEFDDVDGLTMLGVRRFGLVRSSVALKRGFDILAASAGLLIVAPLMAAVAVAIRLDSQGPIFFRQPRVGRDGRHFRIFKYRSMVVDADEHKDRLREHNEAGVGLFKITQDPRVTRVGAFLRRTSLDELPQLLNVLRGEMSLVGPRPLVIDEDAMVVGLDRSRLHLTPGMTGPWQVLGTRVPMQEMVAIDYLYVSNWSLWLDLKLLLRTVQHVLRRGNV
jgi:exopolysaccharide biosynthesis polyprenyl glycosylphosphotransferase